MNNRRKLQRKIIIASIMALLLLPMSFLAQPATSGESTFEGKLAEMRSEYRLAQSDLGEIDPTSEAMKLACLGLRGVYATWLWGKSNDYKEQENWAALAATLEQMTKLQPNFVSVWRFQGWNLAYNLSVEMDDYRYRYYWVTRGIEFIDRGQSYNEHDVMLQWDEGWTTAQKIGRADEVVQYRRLFADDEYQMVENIFGSDQLIAWQEDNRLDNWYVGKQSFLDAMQLFETDSQESGARQSLTLNVLLFYSEPTKCQLKFATAREKEGEFGDVARNRWQRAFAEWTDGHAPKPADGTAAREIPLDPRITEPYGVRYFAVSLDQAPTFLMELESAKAERDRLINEMVKNDKGIDILDEIIQKKLDDQRALAENDEFALKQIDWIKRGVTDFSTLTALEKSLVAPSLPHFSEATPDEVYRWPSLIADAEMYARAGTLLQEARDAQMKLDQIRQNQQLVNYGYWRDRCEAECTALGLGAREDFYNAQQAMNEDQLTLAQELYESGFRKWRELIDSGNGKDGYYDLVDDGETGEDIVEHARRYEELLARVNKEFPADFPLRDVVGRRNPMPPIGDINPDDNY